MLYICIIITPLFSDPDKMYYDGYDEEAVDEILPNLYMSMYELGIWSKPENSPYIWYFFCMLNHCTNMKS